MRADRLLSLMFLLQAKGRMTGDELAEALSVSKRTIYRDIEALNLAGVPIYTQEGRSGGVYLDKAYRISLTGLGREEIQSLFIAGAPGPLQDIGLNGAVENALLKLLAALPLRHRDEAEQMRQRVYFDPSQWFFQRDVSQWMPQLMEAVFGDRKLHLHYLRGNGTPAEAVLCPYGLVAKLDVWYLVAMSEAGEMRTFRVSRFRSLRVLDELFERLPTFELASYWKTSAEQFRESKPRYLLKLRAAPESAGIIRYLQEAYGAQSSAPDPDGWTPLTLHLSAMQEARMVVMAMGRQVEIVEPDSLREEVRAWLRDLNAYYGV